MTTRTGHDGACVYALAAIVGASHPATHGPLVLNRPISRVASMLVPRLILRAPQAFEHGFAQIRSELNIPAGFPAEVLEAADAAHAPDIERVDARHLGFIAVDPPGATDLDQAFFAERLGSDGSAEHGFRVFYAIADLGAFVEPGGPVDVEARSRGNTLYSPDMRTPLHPPIISEDRASLLPGSDKPALLWTIDLDSTGLPTASRLERAIVQVREAISYVEAQRRIDAASDSTMLLLRQVGLLRQQQEVNRGGISLNLPSQEIIDTGDCYDLEYDTSLPVEGWNAQISLLTGIVAGTTMFDAGVGILRTLPSTRKQDLKKLRRQARALDVDWPQDMDYAEAVRKISPDSPHRTAFLLKAARSFRGAGYLAFQGEQPEDAGHGAIASIYAHVTAPLRRLVDRFGNEILLSLYAGEQPPTWALEALEELPGLMGRARSKDSSLERAMVNFTETMLLQSRIGESFDGFVVDLKAKRERAVIQIADPAIVTSVPDDGLKLADRVSLRLDGVDSTKRTLDFTVAAPTETA